MLDIVNASLQEVVFLYVPDHGEMIRGYGAPVSGHGFSTFTNKGEFEVPFLIAFNNAWFLASESMATRVQSRIHQPVSHDNISHTILGLMGVRANVYQPQYDLFSEEFSVSPRYIVDSMRNIYAYDNNPHFEDRMRDIFVDVPLASHSDISASAID